ncbi:hypothetical protein TPAR_07256 [Tolypocladium paradoxum]|uniref:Uncharacterized protein n=1 Tax=Tolypocladium paradoxum TaxID=94208 RepID=A0A2S4KQS7_9HYPO|nr:hypothetical protein TPAR_07256 [Tolypocladium paradoxum]
MKTSLAIILAAAASLASAGIVITPIEANQIVDKASGDCFFGVVTPQGCGHRSKSLICPSPKRG